MYANPRHIRSHDCKVRFNDDENAILEKTAELAGRQKAAFIRELALERLDEILAAEQEANNTTNAA